MKKIIQITLAVLILAISNTLAQENRVTEMTPEQRAEIRMQRYNNDLKLSNEQKTQLIELFIKQEKVRGANTEEQKAFRQNFETEINKILTLEQQSTLKQVREERRNQSQFQKQQDIKRGKNEEVK